MQYRSPGDLRAFRHTVAKKYTWRLEQKIAAAYKLKYFLRILGYNLSFLPSFLPYTCLVYCAWGGPHSDLWVSLGISSPQLTSSQAHANMGFTHDTLA